MGLTVQPVPRADILADISIIHLGVSNCHLLVVGSDFAVNLHGCAQ
jgi:hypothetical protein